MGKISTDKLAELLRAAREKKELEEKRVEEEVERCFPAVATQIVKPVQQTTSPRYQALLDKLKVLKAPSHHIPIEIPEESPKIEVTGNQVATDKYGNLITYNDKQQQHIDMAVIGTSCILLGPAGTGKTTCMQGTVRALISSGAVPVLKNTGHKYLQDGTPGIVICAFTRRAVNNIKRSMTEDLKGNCITIHKLLEYEPVYHEVYDSENDVYKTIMNFEPTRNAIRPLSNTIHTVIIEESSMVSKEPLWEQLQAALPHKCQFIFLGDIQQLPPVFGSAILGYKMLELPVVELTEVYRQALESPIIRLAHRILSGNPIPASEFSQFKAPGKLTLHPWAKKIDSDAALLTAAAFLTRALQNGLYDAEEDMVLLPFNKAFGTIELNKYIAQYIARSQDKIVYEVIAGFNKYYFSAGDKVLVDKEDGIIQEIKKNPSYLGKMPQPASKTLDYWGHNESPEGRGTIEGENEEYNIDLLLEAAAGEIDDKVNQCSHVIVIKMQDTGQIVELDTASELNGMLLGYSLTIHKSQGSEWRKVFLILHQSHATMIQRELLYTAVTRAREELYVICEPESFVNGIKSQRIKGNTLAEKAEYFKGKIESSM